MARLSLKVTSLCLGLLFTACRVADRAVPCRYDPKSDVRACAPVSLHDVRISGWDLTTGGGIGVYPLWRSCRPEIAVDVDLSDDKNPFVWQALDPRGEPSGAPLALEFGSSCWRTSRRVFFAGDWLLELGLNECNFGGPWSLHTYRYDAGGGLIAENDVGRVWAECVGFGEVEATHGGELLVVTSCSAPKDVPPLTMSTWLRPVTMNGEPASDAIEIFQPFEIVAGASSTDSLRCAGGSVIAGEAFEAGDAFVARSRAWAADGSEHDIELARVTAGAETKTARVDMGSVWAPRGAVALGGDVLLLGERLDDSTPATVTLELIRVAPGLTLGTPSVLAVFPPRGPPLVPQAVCPRAMIVAVGADVLVTWDDYPNATTRLVHVDGVTLDERCRWDIENGFDPRLATNGTAVLFSVTREVDSMESAQVAVLTFGE